ncbi:MAG: flagellar M-ring protein FliF C-terminal domain-containing protein, partial [Pseudomonadota bacterium]
EAVSATAFAEKAQGQEARLKQQIEETLTRIVGPGRAKVQVTAELDWNRVTQTQDLFDPESRVVRSTQTKEEKNKSGKAGGNGQVTVGNAVPGQEAGAQGGDQAQESSEKTDETINYEISRTSRTEVLEAGRVKRISVAVLVDGTYKKEGTEMKYLPRGQEELDRIGSLVRSAIGYDEKRGDKVEIVNLQFADTPQGVEETPQDAGFLGSFTMDDYFRIAEMTIIFILGLLMLLFGVRPLIRSVLAPAAGSAAAFGGQPQMQGQMQMQMQDGGGMIAAQPGASPQMMAAQNAAGGGMAQQQQQGNTPLGVSINTNVTSHALESAMAAGSIHKNSVERVGELVKHNPKEAAAVIRTWVNERAA